VLETLTRIVRGAVWKPHYKLMSFALALMAWSYVQGTHVDQVKARVMVQWELPLGLVAVEPLPASIVVNLEGSRFATRRAAENPLILPIDLRASTVGEHGLDFQSFELSGLQGAVTPLSYSPSSVRFMLDEVATKKVRVSPVQVGDPDAAYVIDRLSIRPPVVELRGPREVVKGLYEVPTKPIDVSGVKASQELAVTLDLPRGLGFVSDVPVIAELKVGPLLEARAYNEIPVKIWNHYGWRPVEEGVEVTLEGPSSALDRVKPSEIVALVHLPENISRLRYEAPFGPTEGLRLRVLHGGSDEVKVVRVEPSRVEIYRP
jgi:YbbR domain-containing protein